MPKEPKIRSDLFVDRRCVHVKISKEVHAALRAKLFNHGLSMQELFEEFASLVANDVPKATSIVENLSRKKIKAQIEGTWRKKKDKTLGELDSDTLYSLISDLERRSQEDEEHDE